MGLSVGVSRQNGSDQVRKDRGLNGVIIGLAAVMAFSGVQLWRTVRDYRQGEAAYEALTQYITMPEQEKEPLPESNRKPERQRTTEAHSGVSEALGLREEDSPAVDFSALREINPDVVAWIIIDGTEINYPVVQGETNDQYLRRMFDGTPNHGGSIFLDSRCSPSLTDGHTVIYGHHMKNQTMFSALEQYKQQEFYEAHPRGWLITPQESYRLRFFAGYVTDTGSEAWKIPLEGKEQWLREAMAQSCFQCDETVTGPVQIVTLSTCSDDFEGARFVLHGVLEKDTP